MELYPYQIEAVAELLTHERGIIKAPAGSGKTIIAAAAVSKYQNTRRWKYGKPLHNILWLANTREQLQQAAVACQSLDVNLPSITFRCYQAMESAQGYSLVILDEVHHVAAPVFRRWLDGYTGPRWGFSATPEREDDLKDDVFELIGPIVHEVPRQELVETGKLAKAKVEFVKPNEEDEFFEKIEHEAKIRAAGMSVMGVVGQLARKPVSEIINYQPVAVRQQLAKLLTLSNLDVDDETRELLHALQSSPSEMRLVRKCMADVANSVILSRARWMAALKYGVYENEKRNQKIVELCKEQTKTTLVLVGKIAHGEMLSKQVEGSCVIHSTMRHRTQTVDALKDGSLKIAFVTSLLEEGFDCPRAEVLIATSAGRSANRQEQRTGRVLREWADKKHGLIVDFWDTQHYMLYNQSRARAKTYFSLGYDLTGPESLVADIVQSIGVKLHKSLGFAKKE